MEKNKRKKGEQKIQLGPPTCILLDDFLLQKRRRIKGKRKIVFLI